MTQRMPKLTPFWYTPEGQEEVSFLLRPLTQPQMVEVEEHYRNGRATERAQYVAGTIGIIQVKGIHHPTTGQPAVVPACFDWMDRRLVKLCGLRLIVEDLGLDWDQIMKPLADAPESKALQPQDTDEGN